MIQITLLKNDFEYDIRSLVRAFFPKEEISFGEEERETALYCISIENNNTKVGISLMENGIPIFHKVQDADLQQRRAYKNILKRILYEGLSAITGLTLPWGTLTGIRPTKLFMEKLGQGDPIAEIKNSMKKEYYCSEEKIDLSLEIARKELGILNTIDYINGCSIYIGIPFCPTTCLYCSFTSYSIETYSHLVEDYLKALFLEIDYASICCKNRVISTIYIGGGTPTTLTADQLERLLIKVREAFSFASLKELTVEAGRPDSITRDKLKVLKQYGVTRISINPQSMNQKTLDLIGRKHSTEQIKEAFYLAREEGHDNINMDIILGLPGEGRKEVEHTLNEIEIMSPDDLTVHTLAIKRAAYLNIYKDKYEMLMPEDTAETFQLSYDIALRSGYKPYYLYRQKNIADNLENIGYAKPGKEGIYNILIMEEMQTIFALGAGGASKFVFQDERNIKRVENVKSVKDYTERVDEMIKRKEIFLTENDWIL